jgi:hypothetical protein
MCRGCDYHAREYEEDVNACLTHRLKLVEQIVFRIGEEKSSRSRVDVDNHHRGYEAQ